jgi:uncharacterized membrane protein YgcG
MYGYWIRYGRNAYLGCFTSATQHARGEVVLVESPRGAELGEILCTADVANLADGTLIRSASAGDLASANEQNLRARAMLPQLATLAEALPVLVVDAEMMHDAQTLIVHVMPWDYANLDAYATTAAETLGVAVQILNLANASQEPLAAPTCGSGGCGSGGCGSGGCSTGGCSTGGCSRNQKATATELTTYFRELRKRMPLA